MVTWVKVKEGHKFVITDKGRNHPRINAKFEPSDGHKNGYVLAVPDSWIKEGYVKEERI